MLDRGVLLRGTSCKQTEAQFVLSNARNVDMEIFCARLLLGYKDNKIKNIKTTHTVVRSRNRLSVRYLAYI